MIELNMAKFNVKNPQTGEFEPLDGATQAKFQSDWNQTDNTAGDFIKNKPTLGAAAGKGVDTSPTSGSENLVTSGGVYNAIQSSGDSYTKSETDALLSGKASLVDGKVPSTQLPSYVDDVLEYSDTSAFPATGESGKIYIATDTNKTYRWGGSAYAEISESLALGETASTAYAGNKGKANADAIAAIKDGTNLDSFADVENALSGKVTAVSGKGLSTNDYTTTEKNKLAGIASGAEVNVQSDWSVTSSTSDAFIKNKPTILSLGETSSTAYAGNKGKTNATNIGTMSNLTTTTKTSLVAAINEVNATIGNINTVLESVL